MTHKQLVNTYNLTKNAKLVRIDEGLHERAKKLADRSQNVTLTFIVNNALEDFLNYYDDGDEIELVVTVKKRSSN